MSKGLTRAVQALCWECDNERGNCGAPSCPLYAFRKGNDPDKAIPWYTLPKKQWLEGSIAAHVNGVLIERAEPTEAQVSAGERLRKLRDGVADAAK